jgi:hypothetical protein
MIAILSSLQNHSNEHRSNLAVPAFPASVYYASLARAAQLATISLTLQLQFIPQIS